MSELRIQREPFTVSAVRFSGCEQGPMFVCLPGACYERRPHVTLSPCDRCRHISSLRDGFQRRTSGAEVLSLLRMNAVCDFAACDRCRHISSLGRDGFQRRTSGAEALSLLRTNAACNFVACDHCRHKSTLRDGFQRQTSGGEVLIRRATASLYTDHSTSTIVRQSKGTATRQFAFC
jgi:hypothetical protein